MRFCGLLHPLWPSLVSVAFRERSCTNDGSCGVICTAVVRFVVCLVHIGGAQSSCGRFCVLWSFLFVQPCFCSTDFGFCGLLLWSLLSVRSPIAVELR